MTKNELSDGRRPFNCADQSTPTWRQRADLCAELLAEVIAKVPRAKPKVADIGCGDQKLRDALVSSGVLVDYAGYDLLPQSVDVRRFDVRSDMVTQPCDVVVMLGVIEYLQELPTVLHRLAGQVPFLVVSHVIRQGDTYTPEMLAKLGWINHLSKAALEDLLFSSGFDVSASRLTPDGRTILLTCVSRFYGNPQ